MPPFEPDETTWKLLQAEHSNGTWVGVELLPIANRVRNLGGSWEDFERLIRASTLWGSYIGSTGDPGRRQLKHLDSAWDKSESSKPFDLDEALSDLGDRIANARWTGQSGSRNRAVALAFVEFCAENNCFTRTMSSYELSKWTAGFSQKTVHRALVDLIKLGLLVKVDRTDRRASSRTANRYQLNLWWKPKVAQATSRPRGAGMPAPNVIGDLRNTSKNSLSQLCLSRRDLWSSRGLGQTAHRVFEVLSDTPQTVREISEQAGLSAGAARNAAKKLADNCLAGCVPGRPVRFFKADTPLDAVEESLGVSGYIEFKKAQTEERQLANRVGYPANYYKPRKTIEYQAV